MFGNSCGLGRCCHSLSATIRWGPSDSGTGVAQRIEEVNEGTRPQFLPCSLVHLPTRSDKDFSKGLNMLRWIRHCLRALVCLLVVHAAKADGPNGVEADILLQGGTVFDGSGSEGAIG